MTTRWSAALPTTARYGSTTAKARSGLDTQRRPTSVWLPAPSRTPGTIPIRRRPARPTMGEPRGPSAAGIRPRHTGPPMSSAVHRRAAHPAHCRDGPADVSPQIGPSRLSTGGVEARGIHGRGIAPAAEGGLTMKPPASTTCQTPRSRQRGTASTMYPQYLPTSLGMAARRKLQQVRPRRRAGWGSGTVGSLAVARDRRGHRHLPGHGEPSGNDGVDSVVEPYGSQRSHAAIRWDRGCAQGALTSGGNGGGHGLALPSRTTACR